MCNEQALSQGGKGMKDIVTHFLFSLFAVCGKLINQPLIWAAGSHTFMGGVKKWNTVTLITH
jgi:hypothetical protein